MRAPGPAPRSYEEEVADFERKKAEWERAVAAGEADLARFAAQDLGDDVVMARHRPAYVPPRPTKPAWHAWPPPPDATVLERFDRAVQHANQKDRDLLYTLSPLIGILRELVAEVEQLRARDAEAAEPVDVPGEEPRRRFLRR